MPLGARFFFLLLLETLRFCSSQDE